MTFFRTATLLLCCQGIGNREYLFFFFLLSPVPSPQSPVTSPQSPFTNIFTLCQLTKEFPAKPSDIH
ncbi:hypothetical protein H5968_25015 [Sphaerospermopsis sp. LEGE 00249]|uniref:hypothetical protein n=1 Tax=Sphaerospermopsis sp. LEGE 00249 TaxID=1380707 RepID=UPI00164D2879|nr:hypothetical protein [Sphaerospermopsis sp. LEGE 00249]MBC5798307.1 hypothetical protein [Sphaerospermopsis sp. LEGE 00249]